MVTASAQGIGDVAQAEVVAFLMSGAAFGGPRPERIDTHAASIFLEGERAWKMKRAVRYAYLDFSTPAQRHVVLEAELRLNRRTAPDLYRDLHRITREADGGLRLDGPGEAIEWLLEMRRFPQDALLAAIADAGKLDERLMMRLADHIAAFHDAAEVARTHDGRERLQRVIDGNYASMRNYPGLLAPGKVRDLAQRSGAAAMAMGALLDTRSLNGRVRHCHGDLHLDNIVLLDGEPRLFDCLEFDAELATTDVLYDLAFLLMDLWHRGCRSEANILFNRYFDVSPEGEDGIALLPLFLSVRAAVRAHVHAAKAARDPGDARAPGQAVSYLELALHLLDPAQPVLLGVGGLSGTGKSSLARAIGGHVGGAPGARVLRTDVLRKRLAGVSPETRLPPQSYTADASRQVYDCLTKTAESLLAGGRSVVADAMFGASWERAQLRGAATHAGVPFHGLWLEASLPTRIARIGGRVNDASDADTGVAASQSPVPAGELADWVTLSADSPLPDVVRAALALSFLRESVDPA